MRSRRRIFEPALLHVEIKIVEAPAPVLERGRAVDAGKPAHEGRLRRPDEEEGPLPTSLERLRRFLQRGHVGGEQHDLVLPESRQVLGQQRVRRQDDSGLERV
jgi:hypothetical protein